MEYALIAIFTALGLAVASFLNVLIDRLPKNESIAYPPSHCPACQQQLAPRDLVPFFSYLRLRGRCRNCQAPIPRRVLGVEIGVGVMWPLLYWHYGLTAQFAVIAVYCCLFVVLMIIDLEHGLLLNRLIFPGMIFAVIISIFLPGTIDAFRLGGSVALLPPAIAQAGIGAAIGFGITLLIVFLSRGGMGLGDVKMAALIGLVAGFPTVIFTLILAAIIGGVVAIIMLTVKRKKRKEAIPFGPALAIASIVTIIWGPDIIIGYLNLIG
jgi:prepilin signal peptidase PulO-like enzyme (type II secretory pathway)